MLTLFALNRSLGEEMPLEVDAGGFSKLEVDQAIELQDRDLKAVNTKSAPSRVKPSPLSGVEVKRGSIKAKLKPASWNVIRLKVS